MMKRILLALMLAGSIGGAVAACNTPAATTTPASLAPAASTPAESTSTESMAPSDSGLPAASDSAAPSGS
jgi:hypothetical protein